MMITDKDFQLTSLKVNPIYKPIFDKLEGRITRQQTALDKSKLWSRSFTKSEVNHMFWHPLILQVLLIGACLFFGVKYRLYLNYIKHD